MKSTSLPLVLIAVVVAGCIGAFLLFRDAGRESSRVEVGNGAAERDARDSRDSMEPSDPPDIAVEAPDPTIRTGPLAAVPTETGPVKDKNGNPLYTLFGRVVDGVSERPVTGFQMWVAATDEGTLDHVTIDPHRMRYFDNELGTFTHRGLKAGRYNLMVRVDGYQDLVMNDVAIPVEQKEFVLRLSRGAYIEGVVSNTDGDTLSDIEVRLNVVRLDDPTRGPRAPLARTDLDGHYMFSDLPTGTYSVALANPDLGAQPGPEIYLGAGASYPMNFSISEHNTLIVTVTDDAGHAVVGAHVRVFSKGGAATMRGETGSDGDVEIEHVPAGSYTLKVYRAGFLRKDVPLAVTSTEGEVPVTVSLALDPNADKTTEKLTPEELKELHDPEKQLEKLHGKHDGG